MKKKLKCILLVDDNESDNFYHKRVIEKAGITDFIGIALNGQEAIDFLQNKSPLGSGDGSLLWPELIFLDINMPVMDGWCFLEEYQELVKAQKGNVVIIMLTASINSADIARSEKILGNGCYLYKPLTLEMLGEVIQNHFPE